MLVPCGLAKEKYYQLIVFMCQHIHFRVKIFLPSRDVI